MTNHLNVLVSNMLPLSKFFLQNYNICGSKKSFKIYIATSHSKKIYTDIEQLLCQKVTFINSKNQFMFPHYT